MNRLLVMFSDKTSYIYYINRKLILFSIFLISFIFFTCDSEPEIIPDAIIHLENISLLQRYLIIFEASLDENMDASKYEFNWDYGDGFLGNGAVVEHAYMSPGLYQVKLTVGGKSHINTDTLTIKVRPSLQLVESYNLDIDEPSGLTFGHNNETLWTVSDRTGQVYHIDLHGNLLHTLAYYGNDLEGISFDPRDASFWLVDESRANLIHLDSSGAEIESEWIAGVSDGSGLEGVSIDSERARIFLLKEKDNSALLILNDSLQTTSYNRLGFAPDYSGMYYSASSDELWLLSHEASSIYLTDTLGNMINAYGVFLEQPEGIVFHEKDSIFYIVDDTLEKLFKYKFWDSE